MRRVILFLIIALCLDLFYSCKTERNIDKVNLYIGTGGYVQAIPGDISYDSIRDNAATFPFGGLTFPGAVVPFGMIQLSPDCNTKGFGWSAGYHYSDSTILGFSHMHTSGNGMGFGHFLFMPGTGETQFEPGNADHSDAGYRSRFSHAREKAFPGYYSVMLDDSKVIAELTATKHAGFHRYTFPKGQSDHLLIDLVHGLGEWANPAAASFSIENDTTISMTRLTRNGITTFMTAIFSKPIAKAEFQVEGKNTFGLKEVSGQNVKACLFFAEDAHPLLVKAGISFTCKSEASNNLLAEITDWNFDQVVSNARKAWEYELGKIKVRGSTADQQSMFYTALYHSTLTPFLFNDVDGSFLAADGKKHSNEGFVNYTFFTLWDTYRTLHPLLTITQSNKINDMINSMLAQADYSSDKLLPLWCLAGKNGFNMAGYSAAPVIAEAIAKGFKGFDAEKAYNYLVGNAINGGFSGHAEFVTKGFVPADKFNMSVPKTLEYAFCDWNIAQIGRALKAENAIQFEKSSSNYKNLYDSSTGFFRPKLSDGSWRTPFDPRAVSHQFPGQDYMESNAWQYNWHVMHDVQGMIDLIGGKEAFCSKLDSLFDQPTYLTGSYAADVSGLIGQYAQGNQPDHHAAYLYAYAGKPWKTQERVREIMQKTYFNNPDGLPGNDDGGEMSAWYVFSSLGFYPVNPAEARYVLGIPTFEEAIIQLPDNKKFTIKTTGLSHENRYVKLVKLNGKVWKSIYIDHKTIVAGGLLEFEMGDKKLNCFQ
ncbi:MAG: glycoside hydrolase family 92 protein [Chitinophagaceae bacterium]|nr:glycoside hydrolase family 92 protein [Chitinophagaceae bacterium]